MYNMLTAISNILINSYGSDVTVHIIIHHIESYLINGSLLTIFVILYIILYCILYMLYLLYI